MPLSAAMPSAKPASYITAPFRFEPHIIESSNRMSSFKTETPSSGIHRFESLVEPQKASQPKSSPDPLPAEPVQPVLKRRDYSNVIATMEIDIHTMSKQLDEYRRKLAFYPVNEKQLKSWIKSLEDAIQEFAEAVDLLESPTR